MKNSEIEQAEKELSEIEKMTDEAQQNERLKIWIKKWCICFYSDYLAYNNMESGGIQPCPYFFTD